MKHLGAYPLLRPLGSGGLGEVSLTEDPWSGRHVAIKRAAPKEEPRQRLVQEYLLLSSLDLDVLPQAGRIGMLPDGEVYMTMERLRGRGVMSAVRRAGAPGTRKRIRRVCSVLTGLLVALEALHQRGVLHGDLKTRNLFVAPSGAIRLIDLGAARRLDPRTGFADGRRFMGTPRYAAPEQRDCGVLDVRTDLFSVGALAVRLLTDEKPDWPPSPPAALPSHLYELLSRMLAMDPRYRPPSAQAALQVLSPQTPPSLPVRWRGSAIASVSADDHQRRSRWNALQAVHVDGVRIQATGRNLEAAIEPLLEDGDRATLLIQDLHDSESSARKAVSRLLRRAMRRGWALHIRATTAPEPSVRQELPLIDFCVPPPEPQTPETLRALRAAGQWSTLLERTRGADPRLPAERHMVCAAAAGWLALGQRGETARLLAALQPLQRSAEHIVAARLALERRIPRRALSHLAAVARPSPLADALTAAAHHQRGDRAHAQKIFARMSGQPNPESDLIDCYRLLTEDDAPPPLTPEGELERQIITGDAAALEDWVRDAGLSADPEARGGLIARCAARRYSSSTETPAPSVETDPPPTGASQ